MTFFILGAADKRPIVYPLLYVLNLMGDTLLATDDGAYRRLMPDCWSMGHIGNVFVYTSAEINGEVMSRDGIAPGDYEHVVYPLLDDNGERGELTIYTKQDVSHFRDTHPLDAAVQTPEFQTVHIGFTAPKEKGALFIPMTDSVLKECHEVENRCHLNPVKNPKTLNVLSKVLAPAFGRDEKAMRKLLGYKGGNLT